MQKQALLVAVVIAVVVVVVVLLVIYKPLWGRRALLQLSRGRADFLRGIVAAVRTVAPGPPESCDALKCAQPLPARARE